MMDEPGRKVKLLSVTETKGASGDGSATGAGMESRAEATELNPLTRSMAYAIIGLFLVLILTLLLG